jgi:hypothetical protein
VIELIFSQPKRDFKPKPIAPKIQFLKIDQADATCPVLAEKIIRFAFLPNRLHKRRRPAPSDEGRFAIVTDVGAGCGGRRVSRDERR